MIELLVVIAIIGVLASVVLASLNSARENSRNAAYASQIKEYEKALELVHTDTGAYPTVSGSPNPLYWGCIGTGYTGTIAGRCWEGDATATESRGQNFTTAVAAYIDSSVIPGPTDTSVTGAAYQNSGSGYKIRMVFEGADTECLIGTELTGLGNFDDVTLCEYSHQ